MKVIFQYKNRIIIISSKMKWYRRESKVYERMRNRQKP